MNKAVFLDKDGTLTKDVPYNVDITKVEFCEGAFELLKNLTAEGFYLIMISNQSGIARGYFTEEEFGYLKNKIHHDIYQRGVVLHGFYFCPHHPCGIVDKYKIECECRKPKPGMLLQAARDLNIDLESSWMIGDILDDIEAGNKAGCRTILIDNGSEDEWIEAAFRTPSFLVKNLGECADIILSNKANTHYDNHLHK
jgi:D-glycero-D-manno-heptose 1,7-bisphosphate phosphatase